eukprot:3768478-Alexandrium_andersonii.AAC.1
MGRWWRSWQIGRLGAARCPRASCAVQFLDERPGEDPLPANNGAESALLLLPLLLLLFRRRCRCLLLLLPVAAAVAVAASAAAAAPSTCASQGPCGLQSCGWHQAT